MSDSNDHLAQLRSQLGDVRTVSATEAKNEFGQILDSALRDGAVMITKHDTVKAVLLSIGEYEAITRTRKLDTLSRELVELYASMQRPGTVDAMDRAFNASPKALAAAATKAARKRR